MSDLSWHTAQKLLDPAVIQLGTLMLWATSPALLYSQVIPNGRTPPTPLERSCKLKQICHQTLSVKESKIVSYVWLLIYIFICNASLYGTTKILFFVLNDENYVILTNLVICFHSLWKLLDLSYNLWGSLNTSRFINHVPKRMKGETRVI